MHFNKQLKRGYLALGGLFALGLVFMSTPQFALVKEQIRVSAFATSTCETPRKHHWQLASVPTDIDPLLLHKAMICRV